MAYNAPNNQDVNPAKAYAILVVRNCEVSGTCAAYAFGLVEYSATSSAPALQLARDR